MSGVVQSVQIGKNCLTLGTNQVSSSRLSMSLDSSHRLTDLIERIELELCFLFHCEHVYMMCAGGGGGGGGDEIKIYSMSEGK